jgi:benzoyl-CoA 2,3-dioxygenase component B
LFFAQVIFNLPYASCHVQFHVFKVARLVINPNFWRGDPAGILTWFIAWFHQRLDEWLPTKADGDYIQSLMKPCYEPGQYASWIAPPKVGIDNKPGDFEYVKLHMA